MISIALRLVVLSAVSCLAVSVNADTHGPICTWHADPTTTMTVQWIESRDYPTDVWFSAAAGFGYGDGDDATELDMIDQHGKAYIRHTFTTESVAGAEKLLLRIRYDDAFIAYLNGQEIARGGFADDEDDQQKVASHEASRFEEFEIANFAAMLKAKDNVLAIEGFNVSLGSSDFSLHPALVTTSGPDADVKRIIPRSAEWNVFYGGEPAQGWKTDASAAPPAERAPPSDYQIAYRRLGKAGRTATAGEEDWRTEITVERQPFADSGANVFFANFAGLQPDTSYEFRITQRGESETSELGPFKFRTAPDELGAQVKFVTGGDMFHSRELLDAMNACAGRLDPLFALLGGDLAYANARTASRWYAWFDSWHEHAVSSSGRMVPMILAIGNHETSGPNPEDAKFFYSLFQLPQGKTNYAVDFADYLSVIQLDSDHSQRVAAQTDWLRQALEARTAVPNVFAVYHRPTYGTLVKEDLVPVRTEWVPLFEEHHVSAVFENDHHMYKRTYPIRQGGVDHDRGVLYLGDGAWGVQVRAIPQDKVAGLGYIANSASKNHLIEVVITQDSRTYTARTADGAKIDGVTDARRRDELLQATDVK